jgi:putative methionine-R-sulfoxide reductase with GAF domain
VVPAHRNGQVVAVLDIDSDQTGTFDQTDALWLEKIAAAVFTF